MELDEARRLVAHAECRDHGYDIDTVLVMGSWDPVALVCARCRRHWPVGEGEGGYP
jgi:hypothetical protein